MTQQPVRHTWNGSYFVIIIITDIITIIGIIVYGTCSMLFHFDVQVYHLDKRETEYWLVLHVNAHVVEAI